MLGEYAIRWLVVADDTPLTPVLTAQVDLAERQRMEGWTVYENLSFRPRVEAPREGWVAERSGANGPAFEGRVRLADNADPGWVPDWTQSDWANELSGAEGRIRYASDGLRAGLAIGSLIVLVGAAGLALWGRERREDS